MKTLGGQTEIWSQNRKFPEEVTMCLLITDTVIKLLNQSLACPRLMKIKTLILASLLVGRWLRRLQSLCRPLSHHNIRPCNPPTLSSSCCRVHINQSTGTKRRLAKTLDCCR